MFVFAEMFSQLLYDSLTFDLISVYHLHNISVLFHQSSMTPFILLFCERKFIIKAITTSVVLTNSLLLRKMYFLKKFILLFSKDTLP